MDSIWKSSIELPKRKSLYESRNVHTVVIGAGLAGILTAYFIQKKGIEVIVIEAKSIAGGETGNTTAKITSQHGMFYDKLIRNIGREKARYYAMANEGAIRVYEEIIQKENISCHFEKRPAYLYSTCEKGIAKLKKEAEAATALGIEAYFLEGSKITELPSAMKISGAVCFKNQAQFQPLEFIEHLSRQLEIYENTRVLSVKQHKVYTDKGNITAENIVFATHYPIINIPGFYFLRQHQERSYVIALKGQKELTGMYYSIEPNGLSLRSFGTTLLVGGGNHRTGKIKKGENGNRKETRKNDINQKERNQKERNQKERNQKERNQKERNQKERNQKERNQKERISKERIKKEQTTMGYSFLRKMKQTYYPNAEEAGAWSAQDCMPHDEIPFIGKYSMLRPYWYVATGFKKWGMTSAMIAAITISNRISNQINNQVNNRMDGNTHPYERAFSPQRFLFRASVKNLMKDIWESILGLGKGIFTSKEHRCPHMGCKLEWNKEEGSWECPCHGSGFSSDGKLQDNPAQTDLNNHSFF